MSALQTTTLTLRPCCPGDRTDFIALELDAEVMHFLNGGAVDHERTAPKDVTFLMPRGSEPFVWTARRTTTGAFVGWFCLFPESETLAEIGYRLRREEWGQGLASEGATALVDWGFASSGFEKLVACTLAVNIGSRRVMEKIGMRHVRTEFPTFPSRIPGAEEGEVWYELLRSEWRSQEPSGR
ncbi:GCN5 family acetyltransferase [Bosea sp. Root381]|uniref:GNAT family N-acetyltransferase n=1 Tax=Bosea sp. Root381 TaxID=1736524 RepID=UPI0006FDEF54|nr:GNAT family N-acetyltransferase [Bosea sp. Root381]KRE00394.1 GCN5 family acetyltransferase [Bosea sp. Root381]